ncbi:MAG TPA: ABC transporter ATP-binding protein, partial [Nitrososphaeraceae archaeon]|nr:ABC transporter ATP-binding protein [Nitrososphaeraceae archaeon]
MIEIKNLSKIYKGKKILSNLSFSIKKGEVWGILGPNGAGKTTLLKIICGLVKPSEGQIVLNNINAKQIATIFEDHHFLRHLSGIKNMKLFLKSFHEKKIDLQEEFKKYGLDESKQIKYKFYSSGMKKRLDLMSIFCEDKLLYLLDEPTNTLDIDSIILFNLQVISLKNNNKAFIVSSHHANELEKICSNFLLMNKGTVLCQMTKEETLQNFGSLENAYSAVI